VLCACALGDSIATAQQKAYELCAQIDWQDVYYRTDIGFKAIT
jgi:phosphoribosylamine--glycine ligase